MCGICGIVGLDGAVPAEERVAAMAATMAHRGPDDHGLATDGSVVLGSRRLAIVDLSSRGHMPMVSDDGRYTIVHNGEVYNFRGLRRELERSGHRFRSDTDTEVLLHLYQEHGPAMLDRCNGMFAFAVWDAAEQTLFIARDRLGVKPLYYAEHGGSLHFASEQKALFAAGVPAELDPAVWEELLVFRYVAGSRTPYRGVRRLPPGHHLTVRDGRVELTRWWQVPEPGAGAGGDLRELLDDSVALRLISDVPVGVFLSGGLDSSTIAALVARQAEGAVQGFTVRFEDERYDEGPWAAAVARHCGLRQHEVFVSPDDLPELLEEATWLLDEPIVHASDAHLLALARHARASVTVLLSGEGADELFGGYGRYRPFLHAGAARAAAVVAGALPRRFPLPGPLGRTVELFGRNDPVARLALSSAELDPAVLGLSAEAALGERATLAADAVATGADPVRQVMFYEQHTYLQSLLDRNDRMTMGASIECRVPYLDYRIAQLAASMPTPDLLTVREGKRPLRRIAESLLPAEVLAHRKWGFGVPWQRYLREQPELRRWVEGLPSLEVFSTSPLPPPLIGDAVTSFLAGDDAATALVWQLFRIGLWHEVCVAGRRRALTAA